jgi:hypothetical protein
MTMTISRWDFSLSFNYGHVKLFEVKLLPSRFQKVSHATLFFVQKNVENSQNFAERSTCGNCWGLPPKGNFCGWFAFGDGGLSRSKEEKQNKCGTALVFASACPHCAWRVRQFRCWSLLWARRRRESHASTIQLKESLVSTSTNLHRLRLAPMVFAFSSTMLTTRRSACSSPLEKMTERAALLECPNRWRTVCC